MSVPIDAMVQATADAWASMTPEQRAAMAKEHKVTPFFRRQAKGSPCDSCGGLSKHGAKACEWCGREHA